MDSQADTIMRMIFTDGCTQVTSRNVSLLEDLFDGLDPKLFGLRREAQMATLYVKPSRLSLFHDIRKRVAKHIARFG